MRQVDLDGTTDYSDVLNFEISGSDKEILEQNFPNPFGESTSIPFLISHSDHVRLDILDIFGNTVSTLLDKTLEAGRGTIAWDGLDAKGNTVSEGSYLCRLVVGDVIAIRKITVLR